MKQLLFLPFLIAVAAVLGAVWFYLNALPVSGNTSYKNFEIQSGEFGSQIGSNLQNEGFIKSAIAFKIYTQFSGTSGKIQAGEYRISPSFSLFQIVGVLIKGPIEVWVTIPEGLRREEIAAKVTTALDQDQNFFNSFLSASVNLEGKLFPDTYLLPKESSPSSVVSKMNQNFNTKTKNLTVNGGLTFDQRIILASIIERETKANEERPIVAGILINRLNSGIALQVDASVQYAVANAKCQMLSAKLVCNWWQPISSSDLSIDSPYNTYLNPGLPPSPISNPGLSSIEAAFNPVQSDYYYYLHDSTGQIHYAKTLDEQNANIAKYLQ